MQEGRIEIKTRPQKSGWLEEQVNSVFDIWQSKYFVLDGTELLVFDDDQRLQPTASINLNRCIVDGIWQQGELYIFTIRSLNQNMEEQLVQLGAYSMQEVSEWKETIKNAIILLEYETLFKALEAEEQFDKVIQESDDTISDIDSDDFQEHPGQKVNAQDQLGNVYTSQSLPNELQNIKQDIESKFQDNKSLWTLFQVESQMRIYKQVNQKNNLACYKLQGHLEQIDFSALCSIFQLSVQQQYIKQVYLCCSIHQHQKQFIFIIKNKDPLNEQFWDFYLQEKELYLKVNENYQVYRTKETFYQNKQKYHGMMQTKKIEFFIHINRPYKMILMLHMIKIQKKQKFYKLQNTKKGHISIQVFLSVPLNQIYKNHIIESYLMERLINFSVFIFEFDEVINYFQQLFNLSDKNIIKEKVQQRERRLLGDTYALKNHIPQQIKSFTAIDDINDEDDDKSQYKSKSHISQHRKVGQKKYDPAWDENIHLRVKKLDPEQYQIFTRYKKKNIHVNITDNQYIQFLAARKFIEDDAQEMIDNWQKWKKETNFENLSIDDFPHLHRLKAYRYIGKDFVGRPIGFGVSRYIFPEQLPCDYDEYCLYYCVYLNHMRKLADGHVDQIVMINDVGGLIKSNVDLSLTRKQLKLVLDYFPEGVYKLIAINVDFFTRILWKAIKPFLEKSTQDKIIIIGSDQEEIHSTLLEYMDDELIPVLYGGKNQMYSSY